MKILKLFKIELLKNFNRRNNLFIIISITMCSSGLLLDGDFYLIPKLDEVHISVWWNFMILFLFFSVYNVFILNEEIKNSIILKNIADGLSRKDCFFSKTIWLLFTSLLYTIISFVIIILFFYILKYGFGFEIYYTNLAYVISLNKILAAFLGFLYYGSLAIMFMLLVKNSIIALLLVIGLFVIENIACFVIIIQDIHIDINFIPTVIFSNFLEYSSSNCISFLVLLVYILLINLIVRLLINKIN